MSSVTAEKSRSPAWNWKTKRAIQLAVGTGTYIVG